MSYVNGSEPRRQVLMHLVHGPGSATQLAERLKIAPVRVVTRALKELRERGLAEPSPGPAVRGRLWYATKDGVEIGMRLAKVGP